MKTPVAEGRLQVLQIYRLLQYVHEGDQPQIEKMVDMGVEDLINLTEPQEGTGVLHLAAVANNTDMVSFLLAQGAQPNVQDKRGRTPVMLAAELGHNGMVALLAKNYAEMNLLDAEGKGVLFYCIFPTKRHMRCLQVALHSMADVNNVSLAGTPVFLLACQHAADCSAMCLSILEQGADPNASNQVTGRTALMEAARAGAVELVRAILLRGANPNTLDKKHLHATHFAAMGGFFEVIQVLSAYSADMGVMTSEGDTPLHYAARGGFTDCCRFLAQRGCNPKQKNQEGLLPRQIAKDNGYKAVVKELKKAERIHGKYSKPGVSNPNTPWALTLHDWSHEHEAALRNAFLDESEAKGTETVSREMFISVLQKLQAPVELDQLHKVVVAHDKRREGLVNISDFFKGLKYLQKPFTIASYGPKKKKGEKRGKKGKKKAKFTLPMPICTIPPELISRRDDGGPPHYMIETYQHCTDVTRFDRDHPPVHPIEDDSAWYLDEPERVYININDCVKTGDLESLSLAFSQGVPVDVKDRFYKTPLMTACSSGNYEVAHFLLNLGADVNACDQFRWTPLHHASHAGQLDIMELLVERGAKVDTPTLNGATPLMRAIESCRPCCVDYLIKAGAKVTAENKKEQNCLDIAHAYADLRIVDLVQAKIDTLPKPKENNKGKGGKPQPKPRPATAKEKGHGPVTPAPSEKVVNKAMSLKESVILHSTQIISGQVNKVDISYVPKTVWGKQTSTSQLVEKKQKKRERFSYEVDFEDFMMPFSKNIQQKSLKLTQATN
ncbi:ankyrin repeat and EF-hand domain-containing protein 1 [Coregonus clupeaformis]|uniref:ankyrin repeat and EF-hand domain-containing protein 1 n=1 Tax=Coregonus clupeaformis TaxID=59861 RepID=UPI001BDFD9AB|nr:ankyrin repeat and EF-hand domain-containing protein 1 [Coregonus clupeaformis]XP_041721888.1 ankyrin repeat and EF-hand domain-containing protein 1 [Coregonus clupeaformis]XP_041721889.1 ankyrin repeat and EF-hand domain-containing protein 1 [Coregonus clupeaformis]XP_041721890.1 ankyrin repeat and EF-hand domain-containing protein 1 [Coregonus clupeaformis]XP_045074360.1 ankyrin repeat and EF-hand domain-containing protein 1 [Coregonus clupeaformis]XP_045074361.1 ankyrin repeat and EF-han